jgi:hypothetical protein
MLLGAKHVEDPFIVCGQISTVLYFVLLLFIMPVVSLLDNSLTNLILQKNLLAVTKNFTNLMFRGFKFNIRHISTVSRAFSQSSGGTTFAVGSGVNSSSYDLLAKAKLDLAGAIEKYSSFPTEGSHIASEDFRQLANGVFQSEGTVSARFKGNGLSVYPVVSLGQTYTP